MTEQSLDGIQAVSISNLAEHVGETVLVQGWLYNMRSKGKLHFLQVRDGSGIVQAVMFKGNVSEEEFAAASALTQESSIRVIGECKADERSPGGVEVSVGKLVVVHVAEPYPITPKEHGTGFLMQHRHLWLRSKKQAAILRIRDCVIRAIRDFFHERDFACVDSPMFTPSACEGTTTLFEVGYFDDTAYLTQSGQLYGEASAMALGKIYVFGPTFRAEKSKTRRHLTEFWMVEPEAAYYDLEDVMNLAEDFTAAIVSRVLEERRADLEVLERDISKLEPAANAPYPRITYDEAVKILHEDGHADFPHGEDFGAPHETAIGERFDRPVLVYNWPAKIKAFYMKRDPDNPDIALGVDMISSEGYGELIGGAQREDDLAALQQRIAEHELPEEAFAWYTDLRRYGSVPHGGFGLGLERTIAWITGVDHLRQCIPFPRMLDKIYPVIRPVVCFVLAVALPGQPKPETLPPPKTFAELTARLEKAVGAARLQLLTKFVARRELPAADAQRARLLLASEYLRRLEAGRALAEFETAYAGAKGADPATRSRRARGLYGIAQAAELLGPKREKECREALDLLIKDYRDLLYARYAIAAKARLQARSAVHIHKPAPKIKPVLDLAGRSHSSAARAGKPWLLLFVAPEDAQGVAWMRKLVAQWRRGGGKETAILMFAVDHDAARVRSMVRKEKLAFPVVHTGAEFLSPVMLQYGVQALPEAFLVGPDGTLLLQSPTPKLLRRAARALRRP